MKLLLNINISNNANLTVEASSLEELDVVRVYLQGQGIKSGLPETSAPAEAVEKATPAEKPAAKEKPAKPAEKPVGKPKAGAKAATAAKTAAGPTIEEVTAKLTAVADKFGVPEALVMNQRFGVKKAGELKPEQYAAYIAFAAHCLDDDAEPSGAHPDFDGEEDAGEDDVSALV